MIYQFEINCPFVVVKKSWSLFPWREKSRYLSFFTVGKKKYFYEPICLPKTAAVKEFKPAKVLAKMCLNFCLSGMNSVCIWLDDCLEFSFLMIKCRDSSS